MEPAKHALAKEDVPVFVTNVSILEHFYYEQGYLHALFELKV